MGVSADRVSVSVGNHALLSPVSFDAAPGDVVAVRGGNGAGKTTLLRVLAASTAATSGHVLMEGVPVDARSARFRRRVAAMIGPPPLARNLTLLEHLNLVGLTWGESAEAATHRSGELLGSLGIEALASRFPHELSSGQTQLFGFALTLARPSEVLLLDEPEQRLDADRLALVAQCIRDVADAGGTVIMATHSARLAGEVASHTLTLVEPRDGAAPQ
jgi:ABC-2 type transport system ATP-binding protein